MSNGVKVVKADEKRQADNDAYIRRHAKSLRIALEKKPAAEAKKIVQKEFNKILLDAGS